MLFALTLTLALSSTAPLAGPMVVVHTGGEHAEAAANAVAGRLGVPAQGTPITNECAHDVACIARPDVQQLVVVSANDCVGNCAIHLELVRADGASMAQQDIVTSSWATMPALVGAAA